MATHKSRNTHWLTVSLMIVGIIVLFVLPHIYSADSEPLNRTQMLNGLADFLLLLTLANGWNLFSGSTGLIDLGHTVFFGLGVYSVAVLMHHFTIPFPVAVIGAILCSIVYAIGIGAILVRLHGGYFAIATFALLVLLRGLVSVARPITGGGIGLVVPLTYDVLVYYYAALTCLLVILISILLINRSSLRTLLRAIQQDSVAASVRGIPVRQYWLLTYVLAGVFSAVVGSIWFYRHTAIDPDSVFIETQSFELIVIVFVGGLGTISGPIIGGVLIYVLLGAVSADWRLIIEGVLLIIFISYFPKGVTGLWQNGLRHLYTRVTVNNPTNGDMSDEG